MHECIPYENSKIFPFNAPAQNRYRAEHLAKHQFLYQPMSTK